MSRNTMPSVVCPVTHFPDLLFRKYASTSQLLRYIRCWELTSTPPFWNCHQPKKLSQPKFVPSLQDNTQPMAGHRGMQITDFLASWDNIEGHSSSRASIISLEAPDAILWSSALLLRPSPTLLAFLET